MKQAPDPNKGRAKAMQTPAQDFLREMARYMMQQQGARSAMPRRELSVGDRLYGWRPNRRATDRINEQRRRGHFSNTGLRKRPPEEPGDVVKSGVETRNSEVREAISDTTSRVRPVDRFIDSLRSGRMDKPLPPPQTGPPDPRYLPGEDDDYSTFSPEDLLVEPQRSGGWADDRFIDSLRSGPMDKPRPGGRGGEVQYDMLPDSLENPGAYGKPESFSVDPRDPSFYINLMKRRKVTPIYSDQEMNEEENDMVKGFMHYENLRGIQRQRALGDDDYWEQ